MTEPAAPTTPPPSPPPPGIDLEQLAALGLALVRPGRKPFYKREKVWLAVLIAAVTIANDKLGWQLDPWTLIAALTPFAALIGIEGAGDLISRHHESAASRTLQVNGHGAPPPG